MESYNEGSGRSILKTCIIQIPRNRLQSTSLALMGLEEITASEDSLLEELRLR